MFLLSHPSLEESEGWGTPDHGRTKMKNMGAPPADPSENCMEEADMCTDANCHSDRCGTRFAPLQVNGDMIHIHRDLS
jgi:hypothetical protein